MMGCAGHLVWRDPFTSDGRRTSIQPDKLNERAAIGRLECSGVFVRGRFTRIPRRGLRSIAQITPMERRMTDASDSAGSAHLQVKMHLQVAPAPSSASARAGRAPVGGFAAPRRELRIRIRMRQPLSPESSSSATMQLWNRAATLTGDVRTRVRGARGLGCKLRTSPRSGGCWQASSWGAQWDRPVPTAHAYAGARRKTTRASTEEASAELKQSSALQQVSRAHMHAHHRSSIDSCSCGVD